MSEKRQSVGEDDGQAQRYMDQQDSDVATGPFSGWYDDVYDRIDAVVDKLRDEFPELLHAVRSGSSPEVRLFCPPKRHHFATVRMGIGGYGPYLDQVSAETLGVIRPADPLLDYTSHRTRVTLSCRSKNCRYSGVYREEELLKFYAVATRLGRNWIRLPA